MNEKILNNYNNKEYNLEYCNDEKKEIKQEYDYGVVIFEGEYLNGYSYGKGKEYRYDGKILFEGEYLNRRRNGKGKEYDKNGNVTFEGEFFHDKYWNGKEKKI